MDAIVLNGLSCAARLAAIFVICTLLAGCSDGPNADQVKSAINNYLDAIFGPSSPLNNHMTARDVQDVSCASAQGKPGYICSYKLTVYNPSKNAPDDQGKKEARFVNEQDKWVMMRDK